MRLGRLIFPPVLVVDPVEQQLLVPHLRHHRDRRAEAFVRSALEGERSEVGPRLSFENDHFPRRSGKRDTLDGNRRLRLEAPQKRRDVQQGFVRDELANGLAVRVHSEDDQATLPVEEPAQSLAGSRQLARAGLELDRLGFATGGELLDVRKVHRRGVRFPKAMPTLWIDDQTLDRARLLAQRRGMSLDQMIQDHLRALIASDTAQALAELERLWCEEEGDSGGRVWNRDEAHDRRNSAVNNAE